MGNINQKLWHMQRIYASHIGEDKDDANAISKIPVGRKWLEDHFENSEAYEEMIVAKTRLLKDYPFWGILSMGLRLVEDTSGYIPTMAVDGRHLFYSADFALKLNRGERVYAVGHEILHCLLAHAGERNRGMSHADFDPSEKDPQKMKEQSERAKLWNFANDYIVNDELIIGKVGEFITTIPILHDTKFRGWSSEQVYDHLIEHPEERPQDAQQFDQHIEIEIVEDDEDTEDSEGQNGNPQDGRPTKIKMKRSEWEKMKQEWKENTIRAAAAQKEAEARGECAGGLPAGIQRLLDDLTKPVVNWKNILRRYVMQIMSYDYSFARPNKNFFNDGLTLPGFRSPHDMLDIVIAVDTSGSISQEQLTDFISEMDGIMKSFPAYCIKAWCFDGAVVEDSVTVVKKGDGHMDDIKKFAERIGGGGGTDFEVNWQFMKEEGIKPKLFLFLTDGMPFGSWGWPSYQTGFPTIFLIIGNQRTEAPKSIGMTLHYEDQ